MLEEIKRGDQQSFYAFYNAYHVRLYQYIFKYTRSEWLAEETVQMSFIKIWERRETLSLEYSLSTQLFRIAKSTLVDLLRKEAVRKVVDLPHSEAMETGRSLLDSIEKKDDLKQAMEVIKKMPVMQQQVFTHARIDDLSHKETAALLSISTKTVETHITRAMRRLKKTLSVFL
ncbi:RNA polymerase [Niabella soli DSM 19437]|uniref:RNA polymerase n=2 Tax=Niabella TaxID=379899 RepID=W0F1J3_9BACT|nr:RNA polymerase [Niabella soli DSM 19437]